MNKSLLSGKLHSIDIDPPEIKIKFLQNLDRCLVSVDGVSGSGKSTLTDIFSSVTGFPKLNTGLLYRIYAYNDLFGFAAKKISFDKTGCILLDNCTINEEKYRTRNMDMAVVEYAKKESSRLQIIEIQRMFAEYFPKCIVEGRDIGSVAFPYADVKFFVDADISVRAERKSRTVEEIAERDLVDISRKISPLIKTKDMYTIDTSTDILEESVLKMIGYCYRKLS